MNEEAVKHAVEVLNRALALDPAAMQEFFEQEVDVDDAFGDDPTIQVGTSEKNPRKGGYVLRPLGLINGLFGVDEKQWGFIYGHVDDFGKFTKFTVGPGDDNSG